MTVRGARSARAFNFASRFSARLAFTSGERAFLQ